jgi:hypothetical protein
LSVMSVEVNGARVLIDRFETTDPAVVSLLSGVDVESDRERLVSDALATGARGMMSMGLGLRLDDAEGRIRAAIDGAGIEAVRRLEAAVAAATTGLDLDRSDSHPTRLMGQLHAMFSPDGPLIGSLRAIFDLHGDSPLGNAYRGLQQEVLGLREELARQQGRSEEARRGTAKGADYEECVERNLRQLAKGMGVVVEFTARSPGSLSAVAVVGDFLVTLSDGTRIVIEVKNQVSIGLTGKTGILDELDRAMVNRNAQAAICVSAQPAFPAEVGVLGIFGNRVLVVDDGDGTMVAAALRWISAAQSAAGMDSGIDIPALADGLQRLRAVSQKFTSQRSALTEVSKSVARVSESLAEMRDEVIGMVDDLIRIVRQGTTPTLDRKAG